MPRTAALLLVVALLAPVPASAAPPSRDSVARVISDCSDDGVLRAHTRRALARALRDLPDDLRQYTECEAVIASQLAGLRRVRPVGSAAAVRRDCADHRRLTRRYTRRALRRALRRAPACRTAIRSQLAVV